MLKIKYDLSFRGMYTHQEVVFVDSLQTQLMLALVLMQKLDNQSVQLQNDCISSYVKTYPNIRNHEIVFNNITVEEVNLSHEKIGLLQNFGILVVYEDDLVEWLKHKLHGVLTSSEFQDEVMSESVVRCALINLIDFNKDLPSEISKILLGLLDVTAYNQSLKVS